MNEKQPALFLRLKSRPYELLGVMAFFFFILVLIPSKQVTDFTLGDSYFVLKVKNIYWVFASLLMFSWSIYVVSKSTLLSATLTWIHVLTTLLFAVIFLILLNLDFSPKEPSKRYYAFTDFNNSLYEGFAIFCVVVIAIMLIGQLIFLINVVGGWFKRILRQNVIRKS